MPPMKTLFLATAVTTLALTEQALAHAHLKTATPAADSTIKQSPSVLDLGFTESLNLKCSAATVTGTGRKAIKIGTAALAEGDKTLTIPVSDTLAPGKYTVKWHVLSTDGHKTNGSYSFTVAP